MKVMSNALIYLASRFLYRILEFLRHWYAGGFLAVSHRVFNLFEVLDKQLALKITFRHWLKPLYQDYTVLGYILGFILRTLRIIAGGAVYLAVIVAAAALYILWAILPPYIIYKAF